MEKFKLMKQLEAERQTNAQLREELMCEAQIGPGKKRRLPDTGANHSPLPLSVGSVTAPPDQKAYVVKHMGRLVRDHSGIGRFAGSTTGVHFVLSVQDACRSILPSLDPFPESCFNSHLLQPTNNYPGASHVIRSSALPARQLPTTFEDAQKYLNMNMEDFMRQLHLFQNRWSSFCPVIIKDDVIRKAAHFFPGHDRTQPMSDVDYAVFLIILLITQINRPYESTMEARQSMSHFQDDLIVQLYQRISSQAELWSLQALILYSLYMQKSGRRLAMIPLIGIMVRTAQSLGLHRHARRFKFVPGEVELRKRIWWSVYIFDK
jgi:hypothetical protein